MVYGSDPLFFPVDLTIRLGLHGLRMTGNKMYLELLLRLVSKIPDYKDI